MNCHVYVDFDGTIMSCDTTDFLFDRFALPAWHDVEADWAAGQIGSRECMARQADVVLAKSKLLEESWRSGTPCLPFQNLNGVTERLMAWLDGRANRPLFAVGDGADRDDANRLALGA